MGVRSEPRWPGSIIAVRMKEHVTLTQREQTRLQVLNSLMADHMTTEQAATLMGVSARHTRRILAAYRRDGAAALAHGNRGRRSANATPDPLATDVVGPGADSI